jgi:hypothetical protein
MFGFELIPSGEVVTSPLSRGGQELNATYTVRLADFVKTLRITEDEDR